MSAATEEGVVRWTENDVAHEARWHSEAGLAPPQRIVVADDRLTGDAAYRLASQGSSILWRGDYQNARQLLQAIARRADRKPQKPAKPGATPAESFHLLRQARAQRARILGALLVPLDGEYRITLRRAPDVRDACLEAIGPSQGELILTLRELLGLVGAHEWRKKGIDVPALGARIVPWYGVFAPIRGEYVALVAAAPLPPLSLAFDIGTGTGVLAAVLARRGVARIVATDNDARALDCARYNLARLGLSGQVQVIEANLFPEGRAGLVVCNPPWIPGRPSSPIERAVYDPQSQMLKGFLGNLSAHLEPNGEAWLILSDIAEHLGLRTRAELLGLFEAAGLAVLGQTEVKPSHPKAADENDPLHAARRAERTSLWRLALA